jgi:hypothetical protein
MGEDRSESVDGWEFRVGSSTPSVAVTEAMAFVTNRDPLDIDPLETVVDPDALDRMLAGDGTVTLSFTWEDHSVEVSGSGEIVISGGDAGSDPRSTAAEVAELRRRLSQVPLSELDRRGLVDWDRDDDVVRRGPNFEEAWVEQGQVEEAQVEARGE